MAHECTGGGGGRVMGGGVTTRMVRFLPGSHIARSPSRRITWDHMGGSAGRKLERFCNLVT